MAQHTKHAQQCPSRTTIARGCLQPVYSSAIPYYVHTLHKRIHATGLYRTPYSQSLRSMTVSTAIWVVHTRFCYSIRIYNSTLDIMHAAYYSTSNTTAAPPTKRKYNARPTEARTLLPKMAHNIIFEINMYRTEYTLPRPNCSHSCVGRTTHDPNGMSTPLHIVHRYVPYNTRGGHTRRLRYSHLGRTGRTLQLRRKVVELVLL